MEFAIEKFLREECYTTPEEMDPRKPFVIKNGMVEQNPKFDRELIRREAHEKEVERRKTNMGTSFFITFDPLCRVHQIEGAAGTDIRNDILIQAKERFIQIFLRQINSIDASFLRQLHNILQVALCRHPQSGFNNGEIYFWLRGLQLKEDFIFQVIKVFRDSLEEYPIMIQYQEEEYEVFFYGWGFRYY